MLPYIQIILTLIRNNSCIRFLVVNLSYLNCEKFRIYLINWQANLPPLLPTPYSRRTKGKKEISKIWVVFNFWVCVKDQTFKSGRRGFFFKLSFLKIIIKKIKACNYEWINNQIIPPFKVMKYQYSYIFFRLWEVVARALFML